MSASLHPVRHLAFVFEEELILALRQGARLRGSPRAAAADFPTNRVPTHSSRKKIPTSFLVLNARCGSMGDIPAGFQYGRWKTQTGSKEGRTPEQKTQGRN